MSTTLPRDTSELNVSLQNIKDSMEYLHGELDPFINGSTTELKGQRKRDTLRSIVYDIDVELGVIDRMCSPGLPLLSQHVTTRMKKNTLKLKLIAGSFWRLLNPITHRLGDDSQEVLSNLKQLRRTSDALIREITLEAEEPPQRAAIQEAIEDFD